MKIKIIMYICLVLTFYGCKASHEIQTLTKNDSVSVAVKHNTIFLHDTLFYTLPRQIESVVVKDTTSVLQNDYAQSIASITPDGLFHELKTREGGVNIPITTKVITTDSIVYRYKSIEVPIYVEKKLTGWEQIKLEHFTKIAAALMLSLMWMLRRPIAAILRGFMQI